MSKEKIINEISKYSMALLDAPEVLTQLINNTELTLDEITDKSIGYDAKTNEIIIPILDENNIPSGYHRTLVGDNKATNEAAEDNEEYTSINLEESLNSKYYGRNIIFNGVIIGRDPCPYIIPIEVDISCENGNREESKKCAACVLNRDPIKHRFSLIYDIETIVKFINTGSNNINNHIRRHFKIPSYNYCRQVKIDIVDRINVEDIMVTTEIDYGRVDTEYVVHKSLVFDVKLVSNQQYQFWGSTIADPSTQQGIHVIRKVKGARDSISKWKLTDEIYERLCQFQPRHQTMDGIDDKIQEIHKDYVANVTKIHGRNNVLMAFDLVMHSPLSLSFLGKPINKAWMECCIAGDTRTGKTETVKNMVLHYRAGEFLTSGENTTLAGLMGGVQPTHSGRWTLTWGKIPHNDRRALVIDEADNLQENGIMGKLSGVRSTGVVELVKIQSQRALGRTRLIFIANPIEGGVNSHNYGIDIIRELFGKNQDIARLDFAIVCSKDEIPDSEINRIHNDDVAHTYTSDLCHDRVMFAWNLMASEFEYEDGAEDLILYHAERIGQKYWAEMPLALGAEMRIKIAKGAASLAVMMFSIEKEKVLIRKIHVEYFISWLQQQYDSHVFGFLEYSRQRRSETTLRHEEDIELMINNDIDKVNILINSSRVQLADAEDLFSEDRMEARKHIGMLRRCGAIKRQHHFYVKTPPFISWLKRKRDELLAKETGATPF